MNYDAAIALLADGFIDKMDTLIQEGSDIELSRADAEALAATALALLNVETSG